MIGNGKNRYQLLDVEDLCESIWLTMALDADKVNNTSNIGAKEFATMHEDYRAVLDEAGYGKHVRGFPAAENGLKISHGTIDTTIINAPSSTNNKDGRREPKMCQTKKRNQWYFGMKAHIGVDSKLKLIHSAEATAACTRMLTGCSSPATWSTCTWCADDCC